MIGEAFGIGPSSKKVAMEYLRLTDRIGSEFSILLDVPIDQIIKETTNFSVAEAIRRVREGQVDISPGYDGIFGTVRIFSKEERTSGITQSTLI